jgi:site-specific recombinase XerC
VRDARTVKLAYRPVTASALEQYEQVTALELGGMTSAKALKQVGIPAEELARVAAAVNAFCRPRLLRRKLQAATPASAERRVKQQQKLAEPIDDRDFVELYGAESLERLKAREDALVALRVGSESLITRR